MKHTCEHCVKEFDTAQQLNGHVGIHRPGGRYSVSRKKPENNVDHACLQCGDTFPHKHSSSNKFCSNSCQLEWQYINVSLPKLHQGKVKSTSSIVIRYLTETFGRKCSVCGLDHWMDKSIPLDVDHIDGNPTNDLPDNLRFICANCHRQTETWGYKQNKRTLKKQGIHGRRTLGL
jgi:5-methylcytosine-specific restriction endonuclease McrA